MQAVIAAGERGGGFDRASFDEAQTIAELSLGQDIFPRFVENVAGRKLAERPHLCVGDAKRDSLLVRRTSE